MFYPFFIRKKTKATGKKAVHHKIHFNQAAHLVDTTAKIIGIGLIKIRKRKRRLMIIGFKINRNKGNQHTC